MDDIEKTIAVINQMTTDKVIENYALGGATAVIFYTEPIATQDVDIFVHIRETENILTNFQPIFDYLKERGYKIAGEHIYIEGFPVQFLPVSKNLIDEAVREANEFQLGATIVRVMTPEHLTAIMLDTGRHKDYLRIALFLQHNVIDEAKLQSILTNHNLTQKWQQNIHKFQP